MVTEASDCVAVEAWKRRWGEPQLAFTTKSESERCVHGDGSGFFRSVLGLELADDALVSHPDRRCGLALFFVHPAMIHRKQQVFQKERG